MKKLSIALVVLITAALLAILYYTCCIKVNLKTDNEPDTKELIYEYIPLDSMIKYKEDYKNSKYVIKNDSAEVIDGIYIDKHAIKVLKRITAKTQSPSTKNIQGVRAYYGYNAKTKEFGLIFARVDTMDNDGIFYNPNIKSDSGYIWEVVPLDTSMTITVKPKPIGPCPPICD